jgi:hypothetical protein
MRPKTTNALGSVTTTAWYPVNSASADFNVGIQVNVSSGASLTWVVQTTSDDVFNPAVTPEAVTAPSPLDTGTVSETGVITIPVRAVRLSCSVWASGTVSMTIIQGN